MCGICGLLTQEPELGIRESVLRDMISAMWHRGPDDDGVFVGRGIGLGMCRLSIIDVDGGTQPMGNEDGTIHLVLNGEIYNYRELRAELIARGHRFRSRSDAEVVVHLYEEVGEACTQRLRGMFAFALWDEPQHKLMLVRDRLGIKPLYYSQSASGLVFASEVRALLRSGVVPKRPCIEGMRSYLAYGAVQDPLTLVEGVYALGPGCSMVSQNGQIRLRSYWSFPTGTDEVDTSRCEVYARLRSQLSEAVAIHLMSDVRLGAFLSGGIDSGAVVGLMSENSQEPVHTFTVGFKEETYDERKAAEITAKRAGAVHTSMCVPHHQVLADLPKALEAMDQPTIDGINTWYVARATKQAGITVALSGLGGDELFAGYAIFRELPRIMAAGDLFGRFPNTLRRRFGRALTALAPPSDRWRKAGAFLSKDTYNEHPYFGYRVLFSPGEQAGFMRSVDDRFPDTRDLWQQKMQQDAAQASKYDRIGSISYMELRNYMLNTLLRDADCMSMAHSLEVRVPLIDHCLVETVLALPCRFKRDHATSKPLLLGAVRDLLDDKIMQTPKRTFTFPWDSWLRGPLKSTLQEALVTNPGALDAFMSRKALSQVWERFLGGQTNWARPWALYVLSRWLESNLA